MAGRNKMRNLVICLDGTWNTPVQRDRNREIPSNVVKIARAVKSNRTKVGPDQIVYYDTGVGTDGRLDSFIGGITGRGITKNIFQAFLWVDQQLQRK